MKIWHLKFALVTLVIWAFFGTLLDLPAKAEDFSPKVLGGTWLFVIQGFDAFSNSNCAGTCTVRSSSTGDIARYGVCEFIIDGVERRARVMGGRLTRDSHRLWRKYAKVKMRIDVEFMDDGSFVTFASHARTQFAYDDIQRRIIGGKTVQVAVAINGFKTGAGQWSTPLMNGTWTWQWSSNGKKGND